MNNLNIELLCEKSEQIVENCRQILKLQQENKKLIDFMMELLPKDILKKTNREYDYTFNGTYSTVPEYSITTILEPQCGHYHTPNQVIDILQKYINTDFRSLRLQIKNYREYLISTKNNKEE